MTGRQMGKALLAAVFPDRCAYCGEVIPHPDRLCAACAADLPIIEPPTCDYCGCGAEDCVCARHPHPYDRCITPLYYERQVRTGILRMKNAEHPYIAEELALRMIRAFLQSGEERPDGVVYVPMTKREERRRGFNQSRLLAEQVAEGLALPVWPVLQKVQETRPQKSLSAMERTGNVLGVFDADITLSVAGKRLLLIDDLVSTGATAGECAKVLKVYGAQRVVLLVAAVNRG